MQSSFIITIDVEGDNLWSKPDIITTSNSLFIPRFHNLCEKYEFKPTYLVNYEMIQDPFFQDFAKKKLSENVAEVGMHLHAWNSPPISPLTVNDHLYHPYLTEYPSDTMEEKIIFLHKLLEDVLGAKVVSHRAGRWTIDSIYMHILRSIGYKIDCSVTPHVSWGRIYGNPNGKGGADYTHFPAKQYFMDLDNISKETNSSFLEVPVTILKSDQVGLNNKDNKPLWLRPNGKNLDSMLKIVEYAASHDFTYLEFMLHSSELMPGGSPTFKNGDEIEILYCDIEYLFRQISINFKGRTLSEHYLLTTQSASCRLVDDSK